MSVITLYPTGTTTPTGNQMTNPGNCQALDGVVATASYPAGVGGPPPPPPDTSTKYVRGINFGVDAAIGSGATINSVTVNYTYRVNGGGVTGASGVVWTVQAFLSGTGQTTVSAPSPRGNDTYSTLTTESSAISKSSGSWTRADLLDGVFALEFAFQYAGVGIGNSADLDAISVTVDYTAGPAFNPKSTFFMMFEP